jgi:hypothetical protein
MFSAEKFQDHRRDAENFSPPMKKGESISPHLRLSVFICGSMSSACLRVFVIFCRFFTHHDPPAAHFRD